MTGVSLYLVTGLVPVRAAITKLVTVWVALAGSIGKGVRFFVASANARRTTKVIGLQSIRIGGGTVLAIGTISSGGAEGGQRARAPIVTEIIVVQAGAGITVDAADAWGSST